MSASRCKMPKASNRSSGHVATSLALSVIDAEGRRLRADMTMWQLTCCAAACHVIAALCQLDELPAHQVQDFR